MLPTGLFHRARRPDRGQSLVEFALVAPIFFLLIFSVVQFGLILAAQNGLVDGVRSAARRAATYRINELSFDPTVFPSICTTIDDELHNRLSDSLIGYAANRVASQITYEWESNPESGEYFLVAHVHAAFDNVLYVPLVGWFLDSTDGNPDGVLTLFADERMRVENPALEFSSAPSPATQPCP
ncbi:MAG TPA: TadE/TadG family type IV pilus assembly protein [Candidatus Binatia bacterium]|nr:TadE/TadG family type IV pilus assembly protein [Candidatus Binatia bacterium]